MKEEKRTRDDGNAVKQRVETAQWNVLEADVRETQFATYTPVYNFVFHAIQSDTMILLIHRIGWYSSFGFVAMCRNPSTDSASSKITLNS